MNLIPSTDLAAGVVERPAWSCSRLGRAVVVRLERAAGDDRRALAELVVSGDEALLLAAALLECAARTGVIAAREAVMAPQT